MIQLGPVQLQTRHHLIFELPFPYSDLDAGLHSPQAPNGQNGVPDSRENYLGSRPWPEKIEFL